jgi:hypothetical protein
MVSSKKRKHCGEEDTGDSVAPASNRPKKDALHYPIAREWSRQVIDYVLALNSAKDPKEYFAREVSMCKAINELIQIRDDAIRRFFPRLKSFVKGDCIGAGHEKCVFSASAINAETGERVLGVVSNSIIGDNKFHELAAFNAGWNTPVGWYANSDDDEPSIVTRPLEWRKGVIKRDDVTGLYRLVHQWYLYTATNAALLLHPGEETTNNEMYHLATQPTVLHYEHLAARLNVDYIRLNVPIGGLIYARIDPPSYVQFPFSMSNEKRLANGYMLANTVLHFHEQTGILDVKYPLIRSPNPLMFDLMRMFNDLYDHGGVHYLNHPLFNSLEELDQSLQGDRKTFSWNGFLEKLRADSSSIGASYLEIGPMRKSNLAAAAAAAASLS